MSEVVAAAQQGLAGKYKPYPEYKDSGDYWFGQLPAHWQLSKLKYVTSIYGRIGFRGYTVNDIVSEGEGALVLSPSNVIGDVLDLEKKTYLSWGKYYESPEIMVASGDILIVKTGSTFGKSALVKSVSEPSTINPQMALFKNSSLEPRFLSYLLCTKFIRAKIEVSNTGSGIPTMTQENINSFPVPLPDTDEVTRISDFLDYETTRIDRLISQQQRLIELLKEKRQAVISHAVTKGLNPNAPMKDSGIEWLGQVPEHWIVRRLKHTATIQSGIPKGKDLANKETITVPMLRVANVQDGYLSLDSVHELEIEPHELARYSLRTGDVLMNEGGDNDKLGRGAVWSGQRTPCIHQNHVFAIRVDNMEPEWLSWLTSSSYAKFYFYSVAKQSTNLASISSSNVKETPLVLPPKMERVEIMRYLDEKIAKFARLESQATLEIELLQERRTALISAAVTGKIDLRGWKPAAEEAAA